MSCLFLIKKHTHNNTVYEANVFEDYFLAEKDISSCGCDIY